MPERKSIHVINAVRISVTTVHMTTHTGVKKHSCNQCGKGIEQCIQGVKNHLYNQCAASVVRVSSTQKQTGEKHSMKPISKKIICVIIVQANGVQ